MSGAAARGPGVPVAALLLAAVLAGCAFAPAGPLPAMSTALLDTLPAAMPRAPAGPHAIAVLRPDARPLLDTTQMAFRARPHEVGAFALHRWAETPAEMLHPLLVRTLERSGRFAAVLVPPGAGAARFALRTELLELVQDFTVVPPVLRLALRVRVSEQASGRVLAVREIVRVQTMAQGTPAAGVQAANTALADALAELAALVLEVTS
jgi:cholesterol transport system auxiliary component